MASVVLESPALKKLHELERYIRELMSDLSSDRLSNVVRSIYEFKSLPELKSTESWPELRKALEKDSFDLEKATDEIKKLWPDLSLPRAELSKSIASMAKFAIEQGFGSRELILESARVLTLKWIDCDLISRLQGDFHSDCWRWEYAVEIAHCTTIPPEDNPLEDSHSKVVQAERWVYQVFRHEIIVFSCRALAHRQPYQDNKDSTIDRLMTAWQKADEKSEGRVLDDWKLATLDLMQTKTFEIHDRFTLHQKQSVTQLSIGWNAMAIESGSMIESAALSMLATFSNELTAGKSCAEFLRLYEQKWNKIYKSKLTDIALENMFALWEDGKRQKQRIANNQRFEKQPKDQHGNTGSNDATGNEYKKGT
ncbi:hypothetical protein BT63DRAFT_412114 [Microthyrium microscopicum]|uniref:Uncharacterized protein n=1 Tax=Microthyrium microscopicum TaxID=703497 RepID=A0A6A6UGV0_9PEZI|nr:hypothetical protein BT63DRAFT_412114 [Microthyrium microscopicum]